MEIIIGILDKAFYIAFVMAILIALRFGFLFIREVLKSEPQQVKFSKTQLIWFALSVSYILASIFNGIEL